MISSKQKGDISENRVAEIITLGSKGLLSCYKPTTDDDGIDLIINPKGEFKPIFIQIKSRFVLQKSGRFIQNVGQNTFTKSNNFFILFVYFNEDSIEVEKIWLIPSAEFVSKATHIKAGESFKSFYRFNAGPNSKKDAWSNYFVEKSQLGQQLMEIIGKNYQ